MNVHEKATQTRGEEERDEEGEGAGHVASVHEMIIKTHPDLSLSTDHQCVCSASNSVMFQQRCDQEHIPPEALPCAVVKLTN